jgi:RNA polymerase sigma-70 factor, ECF subfamily
VDEAEALVQETHLRAWRFYGGFQGRSPLRAWLHRIATNARLSVLEHRDRRVLPSSLSDPAADPDVSPVRSIWTWHGFSPSRTGW